MRAVTWCGTHDVKVQNVPDPSIINDRDAIVRVTKTCICGSDLHLYDGFIPTMKSGDVVGHEFMGVVEDVGRGVSSLKKGDRVVVPFTIACGNCWFCQQQLWSLCDNSNPNSYIAEQMMGFSPSGLFGYSHMMGGYAGGQSEAVRVPFADVGPMKVPDDLTDEQVIFLSDIFPTGYMAIEHCGLKGGEVVVIWGCGPVGQFAIRSAYLLGAEKVIAIDDVPERLAMAADGGAIAIDMSDQFVYERLRELSGGRGPDVCVDAVGMEAHGMTLDAAADRVKSAVYLTTDRAHALRQAINCCRKGGTVSIPGVYAGFPDKIPVGPAMNKGLTFKMGQTHMMKYMKPLLEHVQKGRIDPTFVITHRMSLDDAPEGYRIFQEKRDGCIKIVMTP